MLKHFQCKNKKKRLPDRSVAARALFILACGFKAVAQHDLVVAPGGAPVLPKKGGGSPVM